MNGRAADPRFWLVKRLSLVLLVLLGGIASDLAAQGTLFEQGRDAFYSGNLSRSRELLEGYLRIEPASLEARLYLARALVALQRNDEALSQIKQVLDQEPENDDALFFLSSLSAALSQKEFSRLYKLAPNSARVHQLMGQSLSLREEYEKAAVEFRKAIEVDPKIQEVYTELGDAERSLGRLNEASEHYQRALEMRPTDYRAAYGLGVCFRFQDELEQAEAQFRKTIDLAPGYAPASLALGQVLIRKGEFEEAIPALQTAIKLEPKMDQAYFQLGRAYQQLGRTEEAREAFEKGRLLQAKNASL